MTGCADARPVRMQIPASAAGTYRDAALRY